MIVVALAARCLKALVVVYAFPRIRLLCSALIELTVVCVLDDEIARVPQQRLLHDLTLIVFEKWLMLVAAIVGSCDLLGRVVQLELLISLLLLCVR